MKSSEHKDKKLKFQLNIRVASVGDAWNSFRGKHMIGVKGGGVGAGHNVLQKHI